MTPSRLMLMTLVSCATLALAGCESAEDKAERYYQAGLALLEEGDKERAALELRNVFDHDGFHKEARLVYAQLMLDLERPTQAYGQYLRLIEQYPDTVEARLALAKMALDQNNWPEVERHGAAALALAPEDPEVRAIDLANRYRTAALEKETETRNALAAEAETLLTELRAKNETGDNSGLVRLVIDNHLSTQQPAKALEVVNSALERRPMIEDLNILKVRLLAQVNDREGTEEHLKRMVDMFPENTEIQQAMIRWFMSQRDLDGAEAFLREKAGDDTGPTENHVQVVQLLSASKGADAARAELIRLQAANAGTENGNFYTGMIAAMDFQSGERDKAIADMRGAIEASETGPQKIRMQVTLAEMLRATGADDETLALVNTVLEEDTGNVKALQMRASYLIADDKTGDAIVALRTALDQEPRNADTLTLLAQAHERDGDTDLVGERLAMAMEASSNAAPQVIRYARFLMSQDRAPVAITVLQDGARRNPGNVQVLGTLANLYIRDNNWSEAQTIVDQLSSGTPEAQRLATELEARILQASNRTDESLELLQQQLSETSTSSDEKTRAIGIIVQTQIRSGKTEAARETLNEALADTPDNTGLRLIDGALSAIEGDVERSEAIYRALIDEFPESEIPVRLLVNTLIGTGQADKGRAVLEEALEKDPNRPNLLWIKASFMEQDSDFDGAIAIYEQLYELNSASPVVANNLASLITTHKNDPESLARAANIVRRLRGTEVPAFQDTYGWIAYRRDNFEEALEYLEPAAAGLPRDALVQFHLGMTYLALNQNDKAKAQLGKALELAGDSPLPQFAQAREALAGLE